MSKFDISPPAWRAASRPLFWIALVLLVLNDHILKGAGVLPGELTGKLSDFAGLIVAPIVLAGLVGAHTRTARALSLLAVGMLFSAINLFPPVAAAIESVLPWSITVDPSDLVALPALGIAWWQMAEKREQTRMALARVGIALGAVACMATSFANEGAACSRDAECRSGWLCCAGVCVDPELHSDNCGGCGFECRSSQVCEDATCQRDTGIRSASDPYMSLPEDMGLDAPVAAPIDPFSPASAEMPLIQGVEQR